MNKFVMTAIAALLAFANPVFAVDARHPEKAQSAANKAVAPMKQMQDNVKKMHSQLDRIGKTTDDAERQKLIAEHMQTMHENMQAAKGMMGGGMACPMMKGGMDMGMMKKDGGSDPESMMQRMQGMEKRMDMMQMMMEQMGKMPTK